MVRHNKYEELTGRISTKS